MTGRGREVIFVALALTLFLMYQAPLLLLGQNTFTHDGFAAFTGFYYFMNCLVQGVLPLWDPYTHAGQPYFYNVICGPSGEAGILLAGLVARLTRVSFLDLFHWYLAVHFLVFALGMYLLAGRLARGFLPRGLVLASVLYGNTFGQISGQDAVILTLAYLPWEMGLFLVLFHGEARAHHVYALALVGVMHLSSSLEFVIGFYGVLGFASVYAVACGSEFRAPRLPVRTWAIALLLVLLALPRSVLILRDGPEIFPALRAEQSQVATLPAGATLEAPETQVASLEPWDQCRPFNPYQYLSTRLLVDVLPIVSNTPLEGLRAQARQVMADSRVGGEYLFHAGFLTLVLAGVAVVRVSRRLVLPIVVPSLWGLWMSLGNDYGLSTLCFRWLPMLDTVHALEHYALFGWAIGIPLLAGLGLATFADPGPAGASLSEAARFIVRHAPALFGGLGLLCLGSQRATGLDHLENLASGVETAVFLLGLASVLWLAGRLILGGPLGSLAARGLLALLTGALLLGGAAALAGLPRQPIPARIALLVAGLELYLLSQLVASRVDGLMAAGKRSLPPTVPLAAVPLSLIYHLALQPERVAGLASGVFVAAWNAGYALGLPVASAAVVAPTSGQRSHLLQWLLPLLALALTVGVGGGYRHGLVASALALAVVWLAARAAAPAATGGADRLDLRGLVLLLVLAQTYPASLDVAHSRQTSRIGLSIPEHPAPMRFSDRRVAVLTVYAQSPPAKEHRPPLPDEEGLFPFSAALARRRNLSLFHAPVWFLRPSLSSNPNYELFCLPAFWRARKGLPRSFWLAAGGVSAPRVQFFDRYDIQTDEEVLRQAWERPEVGREQVYLAPGSLVPFPSRPAGTPSEAARARIHVTAFSPNELELSLQSPVDGLLYVSDGYTRDWTATVDGLPTPVLRAQMAFKAVAVRRGARQVVLRYEPLRMLAGMVAELLALALLALRTFLVGETWASDLDAAFRSREARGAGP